MAQRMGHGHPKGGAAKRLAIRRAMPMMRVPPRGSRLSTQTFPA